MSVLVSTIDNRGHIDKAWRMLGWMRTFNIAEKDVEHFEQKLRNQ